MTQTHVEHSENRTRKRIRRHTGVLLAGLLLAAFAASGCGSSKPNSNGPSKAGAPASQSSSPESSGSSGSSSGIPQNNGGDHDADNSGGPSDGDGNL
jgi:hypothetical protein